MNQQSAMTRSWLPALLGAILQVPSWDLDVRLTEEEVLEDLGWGTRG